MWRHVWRIFKAEHATNVIWVWSPNIQKRSHPGMPDLSAEYPGDKYVDWVGIDGYYYSHTNNDQSFKDVFDPTMAQLRQAAPNKPWLISETGVALGPNKPAQIKNLLHGVLNHPRLNGFVYFDQYKPYDRSDWRFDAPGDSASLQAFTAGIDNHGYATGKPGSLS
jgi:hypothetical protein